MKFLKYDPSTRTATVTLYTPISSEHTPEDGVIRLLESLVAQGAETLVCRVNSPGGSVFVGNVIWSSLRGVKIRKVAMVDGVAASMAAFILFAFDEIQCSSRAKLMFHEPSWDTCGNADALRNAANLLESMTEDLVKVVLPRLKGMDEAQLREKLKADWWMSAGEAKALGLVDAIYDDANLDTPDADGISDPNALFRLFGEKISALHISQQPNQPLNMKEIAKALGLKEDATEAEIAAEVNRIKAEQLQAMNALASQRKTRIKALLDGAVASGKFADAMRPHYEKIAEADLDSAEAIIAGLTGPIRPNDILARNHNDPEAAKKRKDWTFDEWSKNDPDGLYEMKVNSPEAYDDLVARTVK